MHITECFHSIQGEGPFAMHPAIFIRTQGCCSPFCKYCDSKYSWTKGKEMSIEQILNSIKKYNCKLVVITGGEPFIQKDLNYLTKKLLEKRYNVQIETSGKVNFYHSNAVIVCSPKQYDGKFEFKISNQKNKINYYKFVVGNESQLNNVLNFIKQYRIKKNACFLMPLTTYNFKKDLSIKQFVWKQCVKHNMKYSPRLQVDVFGKKRKV
jgi:7-carboxy-7-deazaguanine synthase